MLDRARQNNLRLNKKKTHIGKSEVPFVGHTVTKEGLKPSADRVNSITQMPEPKDVKERETVLGIISYVSKFIPNLSQLNAPLRRLRNQDVEWRWGNEERQAYQKIKEALSNEPVLKYYNPQSPLLLSVDTSQKTSDIDPM